MRKTPLKERLDRTIDRFPDMNPIKVHSSDANAAFNLRYNYRGRRIKVMHPHAHVPKITNEGIVYGPPD